MRHFLDVEFNGFGGALISLALVPEDREALGFYAATYCADPMPWPAEHVIPMLCTEPMERSEVTRKLADYLRCDPEPVIVANWPEDIAHLSLLMVTGPGRRFATPTLVFKLVDLPLFDSRTRSEIPHNAYCDAMALRNYVMRTDH